LVKLTSGECEEGRSLNCEGHCVHTVNSWKCDDRCQNLSMPCHGNCYNSEWILNCLGTCDYKELTHFFCYEDCVSAQTPCNGTCLNPKATLNCKGECKLSEEEGFWYCGQVSISSTFYMRVFCTKVLFSCYVLAKKDFRTKNGRVKCWWNWPQQCQELSRSCNGSCPVSCFCPFSSLYRTSKNDCHFS